MKNNSGSVFWASYGDLMTALFIITLTLFVLSYKMFKDKEAAVIAQAKELELRSQKLAVQESEIDRISQYLLSEQALADSLVQQLEDERGRLLVMEVEFLKLKEIEKSISRLDPQYFGYQPEYKRHILRSQVQFATGSASIQTQYHDMLKNAGLELKRLVDGFQPDENIKYTLIIEGSASKDNYARNYELSYARALELFRLWERQGITFDPNRVEVIISGSGTGGIGRDMQDEKKNQRFIIQLIPKVGIIDIAEAKLDKAAVEAYNRQRMELKDKDTQ